MKMTPLLWRLSVWLCVAVFCWGPSYYVNCTESHQEARRPESFQDISLDEGSGGGSHHHEVEETLVLPTQSENEQMPEQQQQVEQIAVDDKKEQHSELALEVDEPALNLGLEEDGGVSQPDPQTEQGSEYPNVEVSIFQDQDSAPVTASSDPISGFSAEVHDGPSTPNVQDSITDSVSHDAPDITPPEVIDSHLPPADCEVEETNPYDNDNIPPVVLENTSNAHAAGTKTHTDPPLSPLADQHLETNTSHLLEEQDRSSPVTTDTDSSVSNKDPEDIPTFDEWKRKMMMEVEKEKTLSTHTSTNGGSHTVKKVQKNFSNYASVECGAKILGANPEAKSTSAILKENMDLYMLNPCSNKIWFIIELCEPIQVKQLDIANFELFSSTPKDFLVSISDRYPTNKWLKLGTFHARDERTVQSFPLDEHLYAKYVKMFTKYIKVELISHFGSEHFCPLSLIRVFGTSMVEEYEEIADPSERQDDPDDDFDYPPGYTPGEVNYSNNLIGSAKDVILNMVNNIAVNVLGSSPEMQGNLSSQEVNMTDAASLLEAASKSPTADITSVPDSEEVEMSPDLVTTESADTAATEPPPADTSQPSIEEKNVIPLERQEEESISSTITLLDKEEELEEGQEERKDPNVRQQESLDYCALLPSFSSSCSCTASLREYLQQQCSVLQFQQRKCRTMDRTPMSPSIPTPTWPFPPPPSACPEPKQQHSEVHHDKEQAAEQEPGSNASPSEAPQPPGNAVQSQHGSMSERPLLEPSQCSKLPAASASDSSSASLTPVVETPPLSSEVPAKQLKPSTSQDVHAEEKHMDASASPSSSIDAKPNYNTIENSPVTATEAKPNINSSSPESNVSIPTPDMTDQPHILHPTASPHLEQQSDAPAVPEGDASPSEPSTPAPDTDVEPSSGHTIVTETKTEDLTNYISGNGQLPHPTSPDSPFLSSLPTSSLSDIYADPPNGTEPNGNLVHSSSQKESVFMRLNNRIKALEMNMSLSGRYLEQLSQRYRKQMEEMQKAFNKTIIKLQNTSRIAEEQDQRQTESIQLLQSQLENVTQMVLNLSVRVSELQTEVSDRQTYLLLSLLLCLCFGLLLFANHCRSSVMTLHDEAQPPLPKTYTCCPERHFCGDMGLKRSASFPLIHSESLQLAPSKDPEIVHAEETQSLCPPNRKKRRRKMKALDSVGLLVPSFHTAPGLCNGSAVCNGAPVTTNPSALAKRFLQPTFRDSPSEGSSEGSSHSDDPSFCGITTACSRICDGLPPPKTRAEKRALRRRRPKSSCTVVDFVQAPQRDNSRSMPVATINTYMVSRETEPSSGTFVLSGPV